MSPVRGLLYFARLYDAYSHQKQLNLYGYRTMKIPTPQYYVFYNGTDQRAAKETYYLSDAFINPVREGQFEWTATMLNINYGENKALMDACRPLSDYALFIAKLREYVNIEEEKKYAVRKAVKYCIENDILRDFLLKHEAEVYAMELRMLTEYDPVRQRELDRRDAEIAKKEAVEEAHREARCEVAARMVRELNLTEERACEIAGIDLTEYRALKDQRKEKA